MSGDRDGNLAAVDLDRIALPTGRDSNRGRAPVVLQAELQKLMWEKAGPFRTGEKLSDALSRIREMREEELPHLSVASHREFNLDLHDWFELRAMLTTAEAVVGSALARIESRGAHQREDYPDSNQEYLKNQVVELKNGALVYSWVSPVRLSDGRLING